MKGPEAVQTLSTSSQHFNHHLLLEKEETWTKEKTHLVAILIYELWAWCAPNSSNFNFFFFFIFHVQHSKMEFLQFYGWSACRFWSVSQSITWKKKIFKLRIKSPVIRSVLRKNYTTHNTKLKINFLYLLDEELKCFLWWKQKQKKIRLQCTSTRNIVTMIFKYWNSLQTN